MHLKKVSLVFARENDSYVGQKNIVRDYWKSHGVEVVSENSASAADSDFTVLATKRAAENLDAIVVFIPPEHTANLAIQSRDAGVPANVPVIGGPALYAQPLIRIGGKAVEGSIILADYFADAPNELNKKFVVYQKIQSAAG